MASREAAEESPLNTAECCYNLANTARKDSPLLCSVWILHNEQQVEPSRVELS